jgi:hypothetical protein
MISRRNLSQITAAMLVPSSASAALPVPPGNALKCRAVRNGSEIGTASYLFMPDGNRLIVQLAIDIVIKFGPIPVFRYTHRSIETWYGDELYQVDSKTDDDGTPRYMTARRVGASIQVTGSMTEPYAAPPNALDTTYWDSRTITAPLINCEDGRLLKIKVTPAGENKVKLANGEDILARQYNMRGELKLEFWYDDNNVLSGLRLPAKDGSTVIYERM